MRNRIERLRLWLAGSAGILLAVIVAFVLSARYLRHLRVKLPERLGINVVRETDGFTDCQTMQGRTVYCIHAAKAVEHKDGKIGLHDVSVILYGRRGDRHDRIYGDEFEYDKNAEVVRATGLVHMDLQAAAGSDGKAAGGGSAAAGKTLHVTTSGLEYLQKLGVAATNDSIEFETGQMTGHAIGADYSSDTGMLMLHSAVSMSGMAGKRPVTVTAAQASLDNGSRRAFLTDATYVSMGRTVTAKQATLDRRADGTLARVLAVGDVTAVADGATIVAQRGDFGVSGKNQLQSALLNGGVTYAADGPLQQRRGKAEQAVIGFDAKGDANHAVFSGSVHMIERTRATAGHGEPWSQRDLTAAKVETALTAEGAARLQVRDVDATDGARFTVVDEGSLETPGGKGTTELDGDELKAHLLDAEGAGQMPRLDEIAGVGHTVVRQVSPDGMEQMSTGDTLDAKFRPGAFVKQRAGGGAKARSDAVQAVGMHASKVLVSAVQQGHVAVMRRVPAKGVGGKEDVEHATAQRAVYDGDLDRVTLMGGVVLRDAESALWAAQVALDQATGDARAEGGVKAELSQNGTVESDGPQGKTSKSGTAPDKRTSAAEPAHVLAERAELAHAIRIATFYGTPARLWQGGSQVQAPVIEYSRDQRRLVARGEGTSVGNSAQVHTLLASEGSNGLVALDGGAGGAGCPAKTVASGAGPGPARVSAGGPGGMRIASGGLTYSGISREADFTGGVRAEGDGGTIRASEAVVYLQQGAGQQSAKAAAIPGSATGDLGSLSGRIDRMVANGAVTIDETGLHATGARLLYTASDQVFLLTGETGAPPKAVDAQGRSTIGAALRFHPCDASGGERIEALSVVPDTVDAGPAQRVRTEAAVEDERKTAKKRP